MVAVKSGFSIKEILSGLCERHGINGAAVDLFLVGGDKVLCQAGVSEPSVSYLCLLPSPVLVSAPLLTPALPPPAWEAEQLQVEAPRGSVGAWQRTPVSRGCRANFELLFCSCSCVLLHVKPTCSHVNSGVFVPQPLVLHQDSSILATRDLRLEKRTLFR